MARRLSYANVTATLALFIALGGSGYAALNLPANSVTSKQVKNGSLLSKDFKKGQLKARGQRGAAGVQGPQGDRGLAGLPGPSGLAGAPGGQGAKGDAGSDGLAKAYAGISGLGQTLPGAKGISTANITVHPFGEYCINGLSFTPTSISVMPDVLSGDIHPWVAEVQVPSENTGGCGGAQAYIRIAEETIAGANFGVAFISRTGAPHGFYLELN
ncbi:MAG: collagen-like protein [Thermoleophilaceae bacterium]